MKTFTFIISILLISFIFAEDCEDKENPSGHKDCKDLTLTGDEKYCCYFYFKATINDKKEEEKGCVALTKAEYDKIGEDYKKEKEELEKAGYKDLKYDIKCQSSYLQFYLASLLLLLIL